MKSVMRFTGSNRFLYSYIFFDLNLLDQSDRKCVPVNVRSKLLFYSNYYLINMAELKTYSLEDVKKHNTPESCWFVIHDKVYDVTAFLNDVSFSCN